MRSFRCGSVREEGRGCELGKEEDRRELHGRTGWVAEEQELLYLDSMANVIQAGEVEGFSAVGSEGRQAFRSDDLLARGQPHDSSQSADLPSGHLFHVHGHHLYSRVGRPL